MHLKWPWQLCSLRKCCRSNLNFYIFRPCSTVLFSDWSRIRWGRWCKTGYQNSKRDQTVQMFRWKWNFWNPWSQIWTLGSARPFVQGFIYYWQWHIWHLGLDWKRLENLKNKFLWFSIKPLILQKMPNSA